MRRLAFLLAGFMALATLAEAADLPRRGYLGVRLKDMSRGAASRAGFDGAALEITTILPDGSAEGAGLTPEDFILELEGDPVTTVADFVAAVASSREGDTVRLTVSRSGQTRNVAMKVRPYPREEDPAFVTRYTHAKANGERYRLVVTIPRPEAADANGQYPAVYFVTEVGCFNVESPYESPAYKRLAHDFTLQGFVTVRLDKPGCGDSEGGPCPEVSFARELEAFAAGLDETAKVPEVSPGMVILFGHGLGGMMAPYLAADRELAGIVAVGTTYGDWREFELKNLERRNTLSGMAPVENSKQQAVYREFQENLYGKGRKLEDLVRNNPNLEAQFFTDLPYLYAGKVDSYFREVEALDTDVAWAQVTAPVLVLWGETDFVSDPQEHQALADAINTHQRTVATYKTIPRTDHWFKRASDMQTSLSSSGILGGVVQPEVVSVVTAWFVRGGQ